MVAIYEVCRCKEQPSRPTLFSSSYSFAVHDQLSQNQFLARCLHSSSLSIMTYERRRKVHDVIVSWRPESKMTFFTGIDLVSLPRCRPHEASGAIRTPTVKSGSILKFCSRDVTLRRRHVCACPLDLQKGCGDLCLLSEYGRSEKVLPSQDPVLVTSPIKGK